MSDRDRILAKVRALLERTEGKGCTEAEAATALMMARKLMDDYQIGHADLEAEAEGWGEETAATYDPFGPTNSQFIAPILSKFFRVKCYERSTFDGKLVQLFGTKLDVEVAAWVYRFLEQTYEGIWIDHRLATKARKDRRRAFYEGLCRGLYYKLLDERRDEWSAKESTGSELARTVEAALREAFMAAHPDMGKARSSRFSDGATVRAGAERGKQINIARPVATADPKALKGPA